MSSIMQMANVPSASAQVQRHIDGGVGRFGAASGCQIYIDAGQPTASMLGGMSPNTIIRAIGPNSAVGCQW